MEAATREALDHEPTREEFWGREIEVIKSKMLNSIDAEDWDTSDLSDDEKPETTKEEESMEDDLGWETVVRKVCMIKASFPITLLTPDQEGRGTTIRGVVRTEIRFETCR